MTEKESWQLMLDMWEYIRDRIKFIKQYICFNSYEDSLSIEHLKREFLDKKGLKVNWENGCYFCEKLKSCCCDCPLGLSKRYGCNEYGSLYSRAKHLDLKAVAWIISYIKKELKNAE